MSLFLICYDIVEDGRRAKIARLLESQAQRVQASVFEAHLSNAQRKELRSRLSKLIEPKEDSLRIYSICAQCSPKIKLLGLGEVSEEPSLTIV
jgi:CRISPR-associated protein Cas2